MKASIKYGIVFLFMIGAILISCKKTENTNPDMGTYEVDSTETTIDSVTPNSDSTAINHSTTGTTGATGKGTTGSGSAGTTEKGNINNKNTNTKTDSTAAKK